MKNIYTVEIKNSNFSLALYNNDIRVYGDCSCHHTNAYYEQLTNTNGLYTGR